MSKGPWSILGIKREDVQGQGVARPTDQVQQPTASTQPMAQVPRGVNPDINYLVGTIRNMNKVDKAILAAEMLGSDEPIRGLTIDDWYNYIKDTIDELHAEAFRKWAGRYAGQ